MPTCYKAQSFPPFFVNLYSHIYEASFYFDRNLHQQDIFVSNVTHTLLSLAVSLQLHPPTPPDLAQDRQLVEQKRDRAVYTGNAIAISDIFDRKNSVYP